MITKFKLFEDVDIDSEYIFECSIGFMCDKDCEYTEGLEKFSEENYQDFLNNGVTWDEYYEYAFEVFGIEWQSSYGSIKIWTNKTNRTENIDLEGYDEDDFENIRNLVSDALDLEFTIYENENNPEVIKRKKIKQFKI